MVMGMGQVLMEEFLWEEGQAMNPNFLDYRLGTSLDMPPMEVVPVDVYDAEGPFGAKEAGEGTLVGVLPAIANAVYHRLGTRVTELPMTPEKILKHLEEKRRY